MNDITFTEFELDLLYDLLRDRVDCEMRGNWDAVRGDIGVLHTLQGKILTLMPKAQNPEQPSPERIPFQYDNHNKLPD